MHGIHTRAERNPTIRWKRRGAGILVLILDSVTEQAWRRISAYYVRRSGNKAAYRRRAEHLHAMTSGWLPTLCLFLLPPRPPSPPCARRITKWRDRAGIYARGILIRYVTSRVHIVFPSGAASRARKCHFCALRGCLTPRILGSLLFRCTRIAAFGGSLYSSRFETFLRRLGQSFRRKRER